MSSPECTDIAAADAAERLAADMQRGLAEGRFDVVPPEALRTLMTAACRLYAAQVEAGSELPPVTRQCDVDRHHGDGERASEGRQSRGVRTGNVAELDRPLSAVHPPACGEPESARSMDFTSLTGFAGSAE